MCPPRDNRLGASLSFRCRQLCDRHSLELFLKRKTLSQLYLESRHLEFHACFLLSLQHAISYYMDHFRGMFILPKLP